MNRELLKRNIIFNFFTQKEFAKQMLWQENKVTRIIQGKYTPDVNEAKSIAELLNLTLEDFLNIFLDGKYTKEETK